jgi:hypothetical protein
MFHSKYCVLNFFIWGRGRSYRNEDAGRAGPSVGISAAPEDEAQHIDAGSCRATCRDYSAARWHSAVPSAKKFHVVS